MLVLVFHVGKQRYAVDAMAVAEVVPSVPVRPVASASPWVAGLLEYRGHILPVVDLSLLLGGEPTPHRLSSRIAVCDLAQVGAVAEDTPASARRVGLLAEGATRVLRLDPDAESHPGPRTDVRALGRLVSDGEGLIQLVRIEELLPPEIVAELSAGSGEGA